jgi:hypothetical protein
LGALAEAAFYHQWLTEAMRRHPECWEFQRIDHEVARTSFARHDRALLTAYRRTVDERLGQDSQRVPDGTRGTRVSDLTEMTLIRHELGKQKRHIQIRDLIRRSPRSLLQLMPCWMMGPASVAQFLAPGGLEFDLLVMDEASQIRPEDAIGSLARAKQVVVVGDSKQMPPSDAFSTTSDGDGNDDGLIVAEDLKSILDQSEQHYDQESLCWHYRSQHESLILFSNDRYYDQSLIIPPAVHRQHTGLGVKWHYCENATYHSGINEVEAMAVVEQLIQHVVENASRPGPEQESVGVVAMNMKQQALIQELFDRTILEDDDLAAALACYKPQDPIFVKNLENVQGDERDVIIISFTYGPDVATRRVYQRFGPIAKDGGWRRLNVLVTRARRRLHAYASLRAGDVQPSDDPRKRGVADLRAYLSYAESGCLPDFGHATGSGPDSDFEVSVAKVVEDLGFEPRYQVGVQGFLIDIGVVDPESPGTYLCGIECDGASYHSSPVARDRDRLREEILRERGWRIYRVWSTDWFRNRRTEVDRLAQFLRS